METTASVVGTTTISLVATASAIANSTQPAVGASAADWISAIANALLFLGAATGGVFAYWRHRISALDHLVELLDQESHGVRLWNLSEALRGGGADATRTVYDPGGRHLSPRAWKTHKNGSQWEVVGPALGRTTRVWGEPYRSLFADGFGPGHSPDGTKAEFERFSWLVRQIAVACGFESDSRIEHLLRGPLIAHLRRSTATRIPEAMLHFEVVVSRLVRFFDSAEEPDCWEVNRDYFWHSYGLDDPLYRSFRMHLQEDGLLDSSAGLQAWVESARQGAGFKMMSRAYYQVWEQEYIHLDRELNAIPLL